MLVPQGSCCRILTLSANDLAALSRCPYSRVQIWVEEKPVTLRLGHMAPSLVLSLLQERD